MQLCGKCGNHNTEDVIFCGHCANRLNNNCPSCGFKNLMEQKFCGNCGKQLIQDTVLPPPLVTHEAIAPDLQLASPSGGTSSLPQAGLPVAPSNPLNPLSASPPPQVVSVTPPIRSTGTFSADTAFHTEFHSMPDLDAYALLSIEFADWSQILAVFPEPAALDEYRKQCLALMEDRLLGSDTSISGSKRGILFVAFKREKDLMASLEAGMDNAQGLLNLTFEFQGTPLKLRMGLDIEVAQARNPLTSTIERSMGLPGTLTVSEAVYQRTKDRYRFEAVGPVPLGSKSMTFYRLLRTGGQLPSPTDVLGISSPSVPQQSSRSFPQEPSPVTVESSSQFFTDDVTLNPQPQAASVSPPVKSGQTFLADVAVPQPAPQPVAQSAPPARPVSQQPVTGQPASSMQSVDSAHELQRNEPPVTPPSELRPQTGGWSADASEAANGVGPQLPHYISPVLGLYKAPRKANISCEQAVDAIASEMSGFISQGTANNKGRVMSICAADGVGKSSLLHLARQTVDPDGQRAFWMGAQHYRCFHRDGLPLMYWLELLQNLLSLVLEGQSAREVRDRVEEFLIHVYEGACPDEERAVLEDFLSVHPLQPLSVEARGNLGRLEFFLMELFRATSAKRPIVIVMEDLMYADTASLEILTHLLEHQLLEFPVYIVLTQARDYYQGGQLVEALQKCVYKELVIGEMTDAEAERFLNDGPLGGRVSEFPPGIIDGIIRAAKGIPIYLEEALRLLHLQEILVVDMQTGKFVMNQAMDVLPSPLPDNIKTLVRQRLGYLDDDSLYVLEIAATLGEKFAVNMLMALAQMEEAPFNEALTLLFNHGFILPDAVNTGRFRHGLIWESVYENMDVELQVQAHQLISETFENDFNQGVTINPALIAYHSENGELPNRAMNYWNLAGIFCGQVGSLVGMNMSMFRALEVLELAVPDQPLHTQELALRLVETLGMFNLDDDPDLAAGLLEWDFFYRKNEGDAAKLIEPLGFLASAYENRGDFSKALSTLEKALELVDPQAYPLEAASLLISKMEYLITLGRLQQAHDLMAQRIEPVAHSPAAQRQPEFQDSYLQAQLLKAQVMLAQCDGEAGTVLEKALQQARERNLEEMVIALQLTRGQLFLRHGQYETCDREADSLLSAIENMPDSDWFLAQWGLLAMMYHCELADWESASQLVLTVVSKSEKVRDYHTWIVAQAYAGHISGKSGKIKEGRQLLEQSIKLSSSHRFAASALLGWRLLSEFEFDCGNLDVARELAERALEVANKPEIRHVYEAMQLTLLLARILLTQGKPKEAGKLLEPLWPSAAKTKWQPIIADCAFNIGMLYKQLAQGVPADLSRKHLARSVEFFLKAKGIWLDLRNLTNVKKVDAVVPRL